MIDVGKILVSILLFSHLSACSWHLINYYYPDSDTVHLSLNDTVYNY